MKFLKAKVTLSRGADLKDATISHVHEPEAVCLVVCQIQYHSNIDYLFELLRWVVGLSALPGALSGECASQKVVFSGV